MSHQEDDQSKVRGFRGIKRAIIIRSRRYGCIQLRPITINDHLFLTKLLATKLSAREFTVQVIHHQLITPELEIETVGNWGNRLLARVARTWVKHERVLNTDLPEGVGAFEGFQQVINTYVSERNREMAEKLEPIIDPLMDGIRYLSQNRDMILSKETLKRIDERMQNIIHSPLLLAAQKLHQTVLPPVPSYLENIQTTIVAPYESWMKEIEKSIQQLAKTAQVVEQSLQRIVGFAQVNVQKLFSELPDLNTIQQHLEILDKAGVAFEKSGYGFTDHLWSVRFVVELAYVSPKVQQAVITNKILAQTRSNEFEAALRDRMQNSTLLQRRWRIVALALEAHRNRQYLLSIPPLLAQVEGIFTDMLILKGMAIARNGKLYARGADGKEKRDKNQKPIPLTGLSQKAAHSRFQNHDVVQRIVDLFMKYLTENRNAILHGQQTTYGRAKLSTQTLLVLHILAQALSEFEAGKITT